MTNCDVVITPNDEVFINGNKIGKVTDYDMRKDGRMTELVLTMHPTSILFGVVPAATIQTLWDEATLTGSDHADGSVDIARAISNAKARAHGLNPVQHVAPAPVTAAPVKKAIPKYADAAAEPMAEEAPCGEQVTGEKSYTTCKKDYGHTGVHSRYRKG